MVDNQACLRLQALGVRVQTLHLHMHPRLRRVIALDVQVLSMRLQGGENVLTNPLGSSKSSVLTLHKTHTCGRQRVVSS